jgi:hypothetical protein
VQSWSDAGGWRCDWDDDILMVTPKLFWLRFWSKIDLCVLIYMASILIYGYVR